MGDHQASEFADQIGLLAELEAGVDPSLHHGPPALLQPCSLGMEEAPEDETVEDFPTPELQGLSVAFGCSTELAVGYRSIGSVA